LTSLFFICSGDVLTERVEEVKGEFEKRIKQLEVAQIEQFGISQISPSAILQLIDEARIDFPFRPHQGWASQMNREQMIRELIKILDWFQKYFTK